MEESDVKKLLDSIIQSGQYEVDDQGTVSIVCDSEQLAALTGQGLESTLEIENTHLEARGLAQKQSDNENISDDVFKSSKSTIRLKNDIKIEENEIEHSEVTSESIKSEAGTILSCEDGNDENDESTCMLQESENNEVDASALLSEDTTVDVDISQLRVDEAGQYFLQTADGQIIQVMGSISEDLVNVGSENVHIQQQQGQQVDQEDSRNSAVIGLEGQDNDTEGIHYLLLGSDGSDEAEKMYIINTPDGDLETSGENLSISAMMLDGTSLLNVTTATQSIDSPSVTTDTETNITLEKIDEINDFTEKNQVLLENNKINEMETEIVKDSKQKSMKLLNDKLHLVVKNRPIPHSRKREERIHFPLKVEGSPVSLEEGTRIQTDQGEMVALSLASVAANKPGELRNKGNMQYIAQMFGSMVKVLRPVEQEKKPVVEGISIYPCEECGVTLHSEKSYTSHKRKFHLEPKVECFICGEKFTSPHHTRSHIQQVHSKEDYFKCRFCPIETTVLKEILKHRKTHEKDKICKKCGKKYLMVKAFKDHIAICKGVRKRKLTKTINQNKDYFTEEFLSEEENGDTEKEPNSWSDLEEETYYNIPKKRFCFDNKDKELSNVTNSPRKQKTLNTGEEFLLKSKYFDNEIKNITDSESILSNRISRDRSQRCYLCFKLFKNDSELEAHKISFHKSKSSKLVRVKTDGEMEGDEEDLFGMKDSNIYNCLDDSDLTNVQVKPEPPDMSEEFDNITIIMDDVSKSPLVVRPLCITCKAHTETDYKGTSKWYQKTPEVLQCEALLKFEKFFPSAIDRTGLAGPWVMCKKCVSLIDKIADMEEKLNSMKSDLLSRVKGGPVEAKATSIKKDKECILIDSENSNTNSEEMDLLEAENEIDGLGESLLDIENFMKDNCEIMEILRKPKKRGRPSKQQEEKLIPVVLSDVMIDEESIKAFGNIMALEEKYTRMQETDKYTRMLGAQETDGGVTNTQDETDTSKICNAMELKNSASIPQVNIKVNHKNAKNFVTLTSSGKLLQEVKISKSICSLSNLNTNPNLIKIEKETSIELSDETIQSFPNETIDRQSSFCSLEIKQNFDPKLQKIKSSSTTTKKLEAALSEELKCKETLASGKKISSTNKSVSEGLKEPDMPILFNDESDAEFCETSRKETTTNELANLIDLISKDIPTKDDCLKKNTKINNDNADFDFEKDENDEDENEDDKEKSKDKNVKKKVGVKKKIAEERAAMSYPNPDNPKKPWSCAQCHKGFSSKRGAGDHFLASHRGQTFSCEHCSASYVRKRDLIGHYNKVHLNTKPYSCKAEDCEEMFSSHTELYRHMGQVHKSKEEVSHDCDGCGMPFSQKRYLDAHMLICPAKLYGDGQQFKCDICDKKFKIAKYLRIHMRTAHGPSNEQFYCELCMKVLTDRKNLILHMKSHAGQTAVSCGVCGKHFNRKAYLWTHMRTHTNERPYGCNYCPKWFRQYSTWKNHERTHTGEKPFSCSFCSGTFSTSSSMNKHVQYAHYNIRSFSCDICNKAFISKPKLDEHTKVHTGERPYKCNICNRAFNKKTNLRTHMYIHSNNKRFKCEICGEGFMRRSAIEAHLLERHRDIGVMLSTTENVDVTDSREGTQDGTSVTSPFISLMDTEGVNNEDSYIVIYADDDEEIETTDDVEVTVLAENETNTTTLLLHSDNQGVDNIIQIESNKELETENFILQTKKALTPKKKIISQMIIEAEPSTSDSSRLDASTFGIGDIINTHDKSGTQDIAKGKQTLGQKERRDGQTITLINRDVAILTQEMSDGRSITLEDATHSLDTAQVIEMDAEQLELLAT